MEKEIKYQDDIKIIYLCGCTDSKLEGEYDTHCEEHHNWVQCDEWGYGCVCGASK